MNTSVNFLFEELLKSIKSMVIIFLLISICYTVYYAQRPNLYEFSVTIKDTPYMKEDNSKAGDTLSAIKMLGSKTGNSQNISTIKQLLVSKFVAEQLLQDSDPVLRSFLHSLSLKEFVFVKRTLRSILGIQITEEDPAQQLADYLKKTVSFTLVDDTLTLTVKGVTKEAGSILLDKLLYYTDKHHYEQSAKMIEYTQEALNELSERTQDVALRRYLTNKIYEELIAGSSLRPEPPYFYVLLYPTSHKPVKSINGFILNQFFILFAVVIAFVLYAVFVKPYLNEIRLQQTKSRD